MVLAFPPVPDAMHSRTRHLETAVLISDKIDRAPQHASVDLFLIGYKADTPIAASAFSISRVGRRYGVNIAPL